MCDWSSKGCPKSCFIDCTFKSEYRDEYKRTPYSSYKIHFEVPVPCSRFVYPQELYERGNQLLPQHSKYSSTYQSDYKPCERIELRPQTTCIIHSKPDHHFEDIDVKHCGYEKYLDIYATVKTLDHRSFSPREIKHDAITAWDWLKIPKTRGRTIPCDVPIPKRDLQNASKINRPNQSDFVPNTGLLSEYQEEFTHKSLAEPEF